LDPSRKFRRCHINHVRSDLRLQITCLALETNLADGSLRVGIVPPNGYLGMKAPRNSFKDRRLGPAVVLMEAPGSISTRGRLISFADVTGEIKRLLIYASSTIFLLSRRFYLNS